MTREELVEALRPLTLDEQRWLQEPNCLEALYARITEHKELLEEKGRGLASVFSLRDVHASLSERGAHSSGKPRSSMEIHASRDSFFPRDNGILPDQKDIRQHNSPQIGFRRHDRFAIVPEHDHGFVEINYVLTGTCTTVVNGMRFVLGEGDVCILDRKARHTILPTGEADLVLNLLLAPDLFSNTFLSGLEEGGLVARFLADVIAERSEHTHFLSFPTAGNTKVRELVLDLVLEYLFPGIGCEEALRSGLKLLFLSFARCYLERMGEDPGLRLTAAVSGILAHIEAHPVDCTLEAVADRFGYHPNALSRLIRRETGRTFKETLHACRMDRAAYLLDDSTLPITRIGNECGYENQSFFREIFQKRFGMTPGAYRKRKDEIQP